MKLNYKKILNLRKLLSSPKKLFIALILTLITLFISEFLETQNAFEAKVVRVIDGDSFEITSFKGQDKIRLFGTDAPESKQKFGKEAGEFLKTLILNKNVKIFYKDRDKYGRILAKVEFEGKDLGSVMVKSGFAWAYEYYSEIYLAEQIYAKERKLGLWQDENAIEPYEWRKRNLKVK